MSVPDHDLIDHPSHYQSKDGVECIDAIRAALGNASFVDFLRGQVLKYIWRADKKDNFKEDIQKAQFYLDKILEVLSEDR